MGVFLQKMKSETGLKKPMFSLYAFMDSSTCNNLFWGIGKLSKERQISQKSKAKPKNIIVKYDKNNMADQHQ